MSRTAVNQSQGAPRSRPEPETPVVVRAACDADTSAWDAFVRAHPRATFFHQTGWKRVLEETFGYPAHYFIAERGDEVRGVLPLFRCRSIRGRAALYSLPHTVYGGPVGADAQAEAALLEAARGLGTPMAEYRNRHATTLDLPSLPGFVTFEKELPDDCEKVYKTFPKKAREAINQARKRHALEADFAGDFDAFYSMLAASYLNLGTPVFPKRFFDAIRRNFPDETSILNVLHEGRPVAGVLSVTFRGTMMPLYSGEAPGAGRLKPNNFKYFRLMERAVEMGCTRFDFGRSRASNEGVVKFKRNQGFEITELPYQVDGADGEEGAAVTDPNTGFFAKARRIWRRLPAGVAVRLGPGLIKYFP